MDKIKELQDLSVEDLYKKYDEYNYIIYESNDPKVKDEYKILIEYIRKLIDETVLDSEQLSDLNSREYKSYPDYNNPDFNKIISTKLEFNANKLYFNQQTTCGKQNFELGNHQRMLFNFVNKNTPYKSLLIFHGVGVGKTCTAVKISESFRDIYAKENNKIIVLRKGGLGQGWKNTIFDPKMGDNQCSGHEFLDLINETKGFEKRDDKSIKRDVNKLIKKYYDFYAYREFSNLIDNIIKNCDKDEDKERFMIKKVFSNKLLIVDEYHNLRSDDSGDGKKGDKEEQKKALENLLKIVEYSDNLRLILLTATPMYNTSDEIFNLLNILLLNDGRPTIEYKKYVKNGVITKDGTDLLKEKFRGYVSYLRGENPVNFPIRIYPTDYKDKKALKPSECPKKDLFGKDIIRDEQMRFLITYKDELEGGQKKAYEKLIDELDDDRKLSIQDSNIKQICNIYYPSNKNTYGEEGFKSVFNEKKNKFSYKKDVPQILEYDNLNNYSIKIKNIIDNIKGSDGIIFIYSEYIWGGAVPMGLALEHIGFNKYDNKNLLNISDKGSEEGTYIILSRNDKVSNNNDDELKVATSEENKDGDLIKVIIGSSITGEGMDFKNIRQIHVMDPWWHLSKLEQIIGRGIRYCSHIKLPEEKRNVTVFLHTATCDKKETIDHYSYRLGEQKSFEIGRIETILKQNAIDCYLFKDTNVISDSQKLLEVDVKVSKNGVKKFKKSISDKPYSKVCSYQPECEYKCDNINIKELDSYHDITNINDYKKNMKVLYHENNKRIEGRILKIDKDKKYVTVSSNMGKVNKNVPVNKIKLLNKINDDTINYEYFKDLKRNILVYLNELYKINKYWQISDIVDYIQYNKDINTKILYYLINNIVNTKDIIYDENGNQGYIIYKNNIYIFQPIYNNDESVPLFYRTIVNTTNKINTDIISDNIKSELDQLIDKKPDIIYDVKDILDKLKTKYDYLINNKDLKEFKLNSEKSIYDRAIFNLSIDELSMEEKIEFIKYIIKLKDNSKKILKYSYDYLKSHFIQKDDDGKYTLFKYDKDVVGFMLMGKKNNLIYYDRKGEIIDSLIIQKDILNSIKNLDKSEYDKIFNMNKLYIQPFINYSKIVKQSAITEDKNRLDRETVYRYTYKLFDTKTKINRGIAIGGDTGSGPGGFNNVLKKFQDGLDISEFTYLKDNFKKISELSIGIKYRLIQLVFRLKHLKTGHYVISNELNYLKSK